MSLTDDFFALSLASLLTVSVLLMRIHHLRSPFETPSAPALFLPAFSLLLLVRTKPPHAAATTFYSNVDVFLALWHLDIANQRRNAS